MTIALPQHASLDGREGDALLLGGTGMLGRAWQQHLAGLDISFRACGSAQLDLTDAKAIRQQVDGRCGLVINCAAWTDVDGAEAHEAQALAVNATGVGTLAQRCAEVNALLVHYSSDYVFDGRATTPYPTDARRQPLGAYGRSKALGEQLIEASGCEHLIIRASWLYAPWGRNFVRTIAGLLRQRDELRVVNDQRGRPTRVEDLAHTTWRLLSASARGVYHVSDGGTCTWYDFACEIARLADSRCRVLPCRSAEMPRPAPRPAYSVLDLSATEALVGAMTPWQRNLAAVMAQLNQDNA